MRRHHDTRSTHEEQLQREQKPNTEALKPETNEETTEGSAGVRGASPRVLSMTQSRLWALVLTIGNSLGTH